MFVFLIVSWFVIHLVVFFFRNRFLCSFFVCLLVLLVSLLGCVSVFVWLFVWSLVYMCVRLVAYSFGGFCFCCFFVA